MIKKETISEIGEHLNRYCDLSHQFLREGNYALAVFFAITLIEESAKIILISTDRDRIEKTFGNHRKKYLLALNAALRKNPRPDLRSFGEKWIENGKLFDLRNETIYIDYYGTEIQTPKNRFTLTKAWDIIKWAETIYVFVRTNYWPTPIEDIEQAVASVPSHLQDEYRQSIKRYQEGQQKECQQLVDDITMKA